jgi:putative colanic acid biosynthesis acetyltransferase WcaF
MGQHSGIANNVDVYSVAQIVVGDFATISQYAHLCAATHDYDDPEFRLLPKPIVIGDRAWVAAGAFIGPGVTVGEGAVVGAHTVVSRDVEPWAVVAGNPARPIKMRRIRQPRAK